MSILRLSPSPASTARLAELQTKPEYLRQVALYILEGHAHVVTDRYLLMLAAFVLQRLDEEAAA